MKNLKSKDYLGKARLIASTDKGNMGTGFAGTDRGAVITQDVGRDDRPAESISYAASNLVRTDLNSRFQRQQSEPPINRNAFPPTPPPENDGPKPGLQRAGTFSPTASTSKPPGMTNRANSVRDGTGAGPRMNSRRTPREAPINEDAMSPGRRGYSDLDSPGAYPPPLRAGDNMMDRPRMGTVRGESEPRGLTSKYSTARPGRGQRDDRGRLFMETTPRRQMSSDDADDEYPDELYDLYQSTAYSNPYGSSNSSRRNTQRRQPAYSDLDRDSGGSSLDDFEMLNDAGGSLSNRNMSRGTSRSRPIDIRTVRVKMHHGDDTRYLMVSTGIMWDEFLARAQEKLMMRNNFKIRMRDEGDMITVGDGDDWDMALQTSKREARKGGEEMARLEVSYILCLIDIGSDERQVWIQDA